MLRKARALALIGAALASQASASTGRDVQDRIHREVGNGQPVVVHVVVALCDNANQGIVPVPATLGNGQQPSTNLYWGAAYGVKSYLLGRGGYDTVEANGPQPTHVLDRVVLHKTLSRNGTPVDVLVVAEAWDGKHIGGAVARFLDLAAGNSPEQLRLTTELPVTSISAGGNSALVVYVGHNALMDLPTPEPPRPSQSAAPRSSIVLACASDRYFGPLLKHGGSHPLLLTTGLMAPEAYSLDAAISAMVEGGGVREAAAAAYNKYQKCGMRGARNLFKTQP